MPVLCACVRPCLFRANTPLIAWHLLTPLTSPNILLTFREWCGFAPLPTSAPRFDPISRALAPERYTYAVVGNTKVVIICFIKLLRVSTTPSFFHIVLVG